MAVIAIPPRAAASPKAKRNSCARPFPPDLLKRFYRLFVPSHKDPFATQTPEQQKRREWVTRSDVFLTPREMRDHLLGRYWVAPVPKGHTRVLIIDVDINRDDPNDMPRRHERVCRAFPEATPLVFSTPRGGLHLYFILAQPNFSNRVTQWAKDRLVDAGIALAQGKVEVYPNGGKPIRAPLGRDCRLLDPQTLEPITCNREGDLWALDQILAGERYDRLVIPPDYGAIELPVEPSKRRLRLPGDGAFMQEVDRLLRVGLTGRGQRNEALLKLGWYCSRHLGFRGASAVAWMEAWIRDKHNGKSEDYNKRPDQVRQQIVGIVRYYDAEERRGHQGVQKKPRKPRQEGLLSQIEGYLATLGVGDRERRFLGRVLEYAHNKGAASTDGGEHKVEIPSRTLKSFDRSYGEIMEGLAQQNLLVRILNYSTRGRCNTYSVKRLI